ncbi:MAG: energy transducer TonB [Pyrinomonadaceae bacterium]
MRECPTCRRQYPDDLVFCLEDGSSLVEAREAETQFARPRPTAAAGRSRSSYVILALLLILGGGFLIAAGAVGYMIYRAKSEENVFIEPTRSPTPTSTRSPNVVDGTKTPTPIRTPITASTNRPGNVSREPLDEDLLTVDPSREGNRDRKPIPKQISGGVLNGKATSLPKPPYPPAARAVRASGSVSVQVLVDEQGNVISASAVSGHPLLRAAAVQAARSAKFAPTMLSGQAVKVSGVVTYNFVP